MASHDGSNLRTDLAFLGEDADEQTTHRYIFGDASVLLTYAQEGPEATQSSSAIGAAAAALCEYLGNNPKLIPDGVVIELGAGYALTGLVVSQLNPEATVIFTDHDPGVLKTIDYNCTRQDRVHGKCLTEYLPWGPNGSSQIDKIAAVEAQLRKPERSPRLVIGTDVIYAREIVPLLFWTVNELLVAGTGDAFLMSSSSKYDDATDADIEQQCSAYGLTRTIISAEHDKNGPHIQRFTCGQ